MLSLYRNKIRTINIVLITKSYDKSAWCNFSVHCLNLSSQSIKMLDKIIEIIMTILPFLGNSRKKRQMMAQEVKEFSELVKDQYTFLMQQLEKVLKDYFDLSSKVKEMHAEIFSLRGQLTQAAALQCSSKECVQRVQMVTETEG